VPIAAYFKPHAVQESLEIEEEKEEVLNQNNSSKTEIPVIRLSFKKLSRKDYHNNCLIANNPEVVSSI